jgi:hypothetical protein
VQIKNIPEKKKKSSIKCEIIGLRSSVKTPVHIVLYEKKIDGEFYSMSSMNYGDLLSASRLWDKKSPLMQSNELFSNEGLTENDIVVRQINSSMIIERLMT